MNTGGDNRNGREGQGPWVSRAMSLGTSIVAGVGLFTFLGYWLDKRRGGGILFTLIGFAVGMMYMVYEFWQVVSGLNRKPDGDKGDDKRSS